MKIDQKIIPAIGDYKTLETFIKSEYEYGVILDFQLSELASIVQKLKAKKKKVLVHIDLIKGLSNNEYGAIYLIQNLKVDGIISIKPRVIELCKKRNVLTIMRMFLMDTLSFKKSISITKHTCPDYIEVLPGTSPKMLHKVKQSTGINVIAGGLISDSNQINDLLQAGAIGVTTSNPDLW